MLARKALAGTAGAPKVYVEDVFSTYLYTGNGSTQTITNGIDLAGEGGLVWIKARNAAEGHRLLNTISGPTKILRSNSTAAEATIDGGFNNFESNGFSLKADNGWRINSSVDTYASWTFRQAKKFFDVVTYTGDGSNRTISHSLGSTPGCIIVKRTDTTGDWYVYHRSNTANPETDYLLLNSTAATADLDTVWNDTAPTSTVFSIGTNSGVNANTGTYVAYLFAHDAGGFGDAGSDNVISCGSFTQPSSGDATITLGYEPQWVMIKRTDATSNWPMYDIMRSMSVTNDAELLANTSAAEGLLGGGFLYPTATGFVSASGSLSAGTYIYIAIRRGPMKTPTTGTSVFETVTRNTTGADATVNAVITPVDLAISDDRNAIDGQGALWFDRLRGATKFLRSAGTNAEITASDTLTSFAVQNGYTLGADAGAYGINSSPAKAVVYWNFRRAPGFFDVVCYTGNGSTQNVSHNLGVAPELIILKERNGSVDWRVYAAPLGNQWTGYLNLTYQGDTGTTTWNSTNPTSSVFSLGTNGSVNGSGDTYVAYLFASLSGVSKIGTYTGNGSSVTVTTNFQPRFILVKRTDSTGNWIVGDSARGLPTGNDPALFLNTTAAETTGQDWVDVSSTGFTVNETALNANVNTGTYLYLAVA